MLLPQAERSDAGLRSAKPALVTGRASPFSDAVAWAGRPLAKTFTRALWSSWEPTARAFGVNDRRSPKQTFAELDRSSAADLTHNNPVDACARQSAQ